MKLPKLEFGDHGPNFTHINTLTLRSGHTLWYRKINWGNLVSFILGAVVGTIVSKLL